MSISMLPVPIECPGRAAAEPAVGALDGAASVTGNSNGAALPAGALASRSERRCMRRHLNNKLALMPACSASAETDAPGTNLLTTRSCLNAALCTRRLRSARVSCSDMVCTIGLVHTIVGTHAHAMVASARSRSNRAVRPRLRFSHVMAAPPESY